MLFCPKWSGWESRPQWLSSARRFRRLKFEKRGIHTRLRVVHTIEIEIYFSTRIQKHAVKIWNSEYWIQVLEVRVDWFSFFFLVVRTFMNGFRLSFSRREKKENRVSSKCLTFESSGEESIWAWKLESRSSISPPREEAKSYLLLASSNCEGSSRKSLFSWVGSSECSTLEAQDQVEGWKFSRSWPEFLTIRFEISIGVFVNTWMISDSKISYTIETSFENFYSNQISFPTEEKRMKYRRKLALLSRFIRAKFFLRG